MHMFCKTFKNDFSWMEHVSLGRVHLDFHDHDHVGAKHVCVFLPVY